MATGSADVMRAIIQRVNHASVKVKGETISKIGVGLLVLIGIEHADTQADVSKLVNKVSNLRIFGSAEDDSRFDRSVIDIGGSVLLVSQFTLHASLSKGLRPSFVAAAKSEVAQPLFDTTVDTFRALGLDVATGKFGAMMEVLLENAGPATFSYDTKTD